MAFMKIENMLKNIRASFFLAAVLTAMPTVLYAADEFDLFSEAAPKEKASVVDTKKTLTENLEQDKEPEKKDESESESWLKALLTKGTSVLKPKSEKEVIAEEKRIQKVLQSRKSNAANLDISKVKLRMTPKEVEDVLKAQGYKKLSQRFNIPNFIKWRAEELCRMHGVVIFEKLNACAVKVAAENGFQFVEYELYNRYASKESIEVYYTSTFTDNLAHYIYYKSHIPLFDGKSSKNIYLNNLKIFDWWQRIDMKYGEPDNKTEIKWGLGGKKPYLKAGSGAETGTLELADPLLKNLDAARMLNEDTRFANTPYYTF